MAFYIGLHPDQSVTSAVVWEIDGKTARCVLNDQTEKVLSMSPEIAIAHHPNWKFIEMKLAPGQYYRRMARPSSSHPYDSPGYCPDNEENKNSLAKSRGQLQALIEGLDRICRVVQPDPENFGAYGHEMRNLIILASTEVEAHWKAVLKNNGHPARTTHDYVKLAPAMKLGEYEVALSYYPWLDPIKPFENWLPSPQPTQDLRWYGAYNLVKHDREGSFHDATLRHAMEAVTGCFVMMCAQSGWNFALREDEAVRSFFRLVSAPKWEVSEGYTHIPNSQVQFPSPINYSFPT